MTASDGAFPAAQGSEARLNASATFQALGSDLRLQILRELAMGERGVGELSRATGVRTTVVRYHLGILQQDGLVEKAPTRPQGRIGRPTYHYRLRSERAVGGFPVRRYETLSEVLLAVLRDALSREHWEAALREAGRDSGRQLVAAIMQETGVSEWTPQRFVRHCLQGAFAGMGLVTEVAELGPDFVRYRAHTCPFQELAMKHPDPVCDSLDTGFHDGIAEQLGRRVTSHRLKCMGHGAPYCEYSLQWTDREKGKST